MKLSNTCLQITVAALATFALAACPSPGPDNGPDTPDAAMPRCGDGVCQSNENASTCAQDCGGGPRCGNGTCEAGESASTCPSDCQPSAVCGDNVCASSETTSSCPLDCNARLHVTNSSTYTVYYLYIAPCGSSTWGSDQLGSHVINPSTSFTITNIPPGCWGFKATNLDASHYWVTQTGVNLTVAETYTWTLF